MRYCIAYIAAITLQLSGALLLLCGSLSTRREKVIKQFARNNIITRDNNTNKISYDEQAFVEVYKNIYRNISAFIYISVGYLVGIWGDFDNEYAPLVTLCVIGFTIVLLIATHFILEGICKHRKPVNTLINNDELEASGSKPTRETISFDEISQIMDKTDL